MPVTTPPTRVSLPIVLRRLTVLRAVDVTPRMRRITLGGEQLGAFRSGDYDAPAFTTEGADDYVKIFLPEPGSETPALPEQHDGHLHWPRKPAPVARAYTVRRFDPVAGSSIWTSSCTDTAPPVTGPAPPNPAACSTSRDPRSRSSRRRAPTGGCSPATRPHYPHWGASSRPTVARCRCTSSRWSTVRRRNSPISRA
ncbi:Siderophore-interacting protein [Rhodococcus pyridinivorans AK37]|uniref:Siderophore-interacting protein n=1 Tax=Rhodococcus pyridinivorans AK37 TaxID=1114960 RepID=H0JVM8_9NOCA|nr:Siderophore-interacting protein [Rhodococcus pyridinivorans AK37]